MSPIRTVSRSRTPDSKPLLIELDGDPDGGTSGIRVVRRADPNSAPKRLLVVDDEAAILRALAMFLRPRVGVVVASSADEARRVLEEQPIDVILSDYHIGRSDNGLVLLSEVQERWPSVRRLMMSAGARFRPGQAFADGVVERFFAKPFHPEELLGELDGRESSRR